MIQWVSALFLFAAAFSSFGEDLGKPFIYRHVVERLFDLDGFVNQTENFQITHCEVLDEERTLQYEGLGSCIYKTMRLFEIGENDRDEKNIIIHAMLFDEYLFGFKVSWTTVTLAEFIFGLEEKQIDLLIEALEGSLENFVYSLGLGLVNSSETAPSREIMSAFLEEGLKGEKPQEVTQIKIQVIPVEEETLEVKLELLSLKDEVVYEYSMYVISNDELEEYFVVSDDIYFSEYIAENNSAL